MMFGRPKRGMFAPEPAPLAQDRRGGSPRSPEAPDSQREQSSMQERMKPFFGFPPILSYVDTHPKDGFVDAPLAPKGGAYQLLQMLSMRTPEDTRWLTDNHPTPFPFRGPSPVVFEEQRLGLSPQPPLSPYNAQAWHQQAYAGVPSVGAGPGTVLVVPASQQPD